MTAPFVDLDSQETVSSLREVDQKPKKEERESQMQAALSYLEREDTELNRRMSMAYLEVKMRSNTEVGKEIPIEAVLGTIYLSIYTLESDLSSGSVKDHELPGHLEVLVKAKLATRGPDQLARFCLERLERHKPTDLVDPYKKQTAKINWLTVANRVLKEAE